MVPGWFLYLPTRVQNFSFTIAGLIVTAVITGRVGLSVLGRKFNPYLANVKLYVRNATGEQVGVKLKDPAVF